MAVFAALSIGSALFGAMGAGSQAAGAQAQHEMQEFQRKRQNAVRNRQIAKQNALRYINNKKIEEAAGKAKAEAEFYNRYNFEREAESFSLNAMQTESSLAARLEGRNISGKTADDLLDAVMETEERQQANLAMGKANRDRDIGRRYEAQLAQRDWGYTGHEVFMPNPYTGPSGSDAFNMALAGGLMQAGASYMGYQEMSAEPEGTA